MAELWLRGLLPGHEATFADLWVMDPSSPAASTRHGG